MNTIWICEEASAKFRTKYYPAWFGSDADRLCTALDLACVVVHEMVHVCGQDFDDWMDNEGVCHGSYMVENIFRWAMMQRYGDATRSSCCEDLDNDALFGSADYWEMSGSCPDEIAAYAGDVPSLIDSGVDRI
jgi:hypothetical protein